MTLLRNGISLQTGRNHQSNRCQRRQIEKIKNTTAVSFFFLFSAPALLTVRGSPLTARSFARRSFDRSKNARKRKRLLAVYYDAQVYGRKFKNEYLERQFYEGLLKSEPFIVKFIENQSEQLSKLTLYHLKKRATRWSRRAREPSRIPLLFLRGLNKKNSISWRNLSKSSKLHRFVNKVGKLYDAR